MVPQARSVAAQGGVGERSEILIISKMIRKGKGLTERTRNTSQLPVTPTGAAPLELIGR